MKLFKTALEMKEYIDDVMTRVDSIIRTARPCVPKKVSALEYIYMSITEALDEGTPEPHFTTDDFEWADLVYYVGQQDACDLLAIAVVLATLKVRGTACWGWDANHDLTYNMDEALGLWQQLYREVTKRVVHIKCGNANVDDSKLNNLLDVLDIRVKVYVSDGCGDRDHITTFFFNPFNGFVWRDENIDGAMYFMAKNIPYCDTDIMNTSIVDIQSADDHIQ